MDTDAGGLTEDQEIRRLKLNIIDLIREAKNLLIS
jgi:hypothetical protein